MVYAGDLFYMNNVTLKDIYDAIKDFREEVKESYVTRAEFWPVRAIAYGLVGLILITVASAMLGGVVAGR